jgi:hypothetical protein
MLERKGYPLSCGVTLILGKMGFDIIRYAFKRLPDQPPLPNGQGEPTPEPDYDSDEWLGWESRITGLRNRQVLEIKKEETPISWGSPPREEVGTEEADPEESPDVKIKLENMY